MGPRSIPHSWSTSAPAMEHLNPLADPAPYQHLRRSFSGDVIPKFDAQPTGLTSLVVSTVNAGGVATKLPMLLALLLDIEPDIVGVREGGPLFSATPACRAYRTGWYWVLTYQVAG